MDRRQFLKAMGLSIATLSSSAALGAKPPSNTSFLFILADDLGWTDLGCFGSSFYETPNLDLLAAEGMRFTSAYAACPVCSPTRASIMTGKYPARLDLTTYISLNQGNQPENWQRNTPLLPAAYEDRMPLEEVTMAEAFKNHGYATFFAGKWHLGPEGWYPEDQGFDVNKGGYECGGPYGGNKYFSPYGNPRLEDGPEGEHLPDRLASETVKFIREHKDKPFLAYLSFYSVHTPLMARTDLQAKYEEKRQHWPETQWGKEGERKVREVQNHAVYAAMVAALDQAVGEVLDALQETGLYDNTVIIFTSDNGGLSTSEGHPTSNLPLRAGKGWLYEGGIREPLIVRCPGITPEGATCNTPVISTDFYPTMLELAGFPPLKVQHVDGVSFVSLLKGRYGLEREALYWHFPHYANQGGSPGAAVRAGNWKLIRFFEDNHVELYNLEMDVSEEHDLSVAMPEKARALAEMLDRWQRSVGAKFPKVNPGYHIK